MSNVVQFKRKPQGNDDMPENSAYMCPTCGSCTWFLRMDWLCECADGHTFDYLFWNIEDKP